MYIQDLFIKYYDHRPFKSIFANKIIGNISKASLFLANIILPLWFKVFPGEKEFIKKVKTEKQKNVIVCLTSYPTRIKNLWLVIECILRQTNIPLKIVLYLSKEQFPQISKLPKSITKYIHTCLEIKLVEDDIRSHKKYWYAINDFPRTPIITIDDDIIYSSKTIANLIRGAKLHPNSVIALYCHPIKRYNNGKIRPYLEWKGNIQLDIPGNDIFFGSGGGTYFPCGSLKDANQSFEIIRRVCPLADDIWLNAFIRKNGYDVCCIKETISVPEWYISNNTKLNTINNGNNQNDIQLTNVQLFMKNIYQIDPFA